MYHVIYIHPCMTRSLPGGVQEGVISKLNLYNPSASPALPEAASNQQVMVCWLVVMFFHTIRLLQYTFLLGFR